MVDIDTEKIVRDLLPLAKDELTHLNGALAAAKKVEFPRGEYNFTNKVSEIDSCYQKATTYNNWIINSSSKLAKSISDDIESINNITIEEITKKETIVK